MRVSSSAMVCFRGWCWPGDDASTASGAAFAGAMSVGLCLRWGSRGAVVTTAGRAASSMQVAPFRCVRSRLLGLPLKGAGDATGLCCVKMMRGSRALEAAHPYCLREESADVCGGRGAGASTTYASGV